jgi:hypothetical protein
MGVPSYPDHVEREYGSIVKLFSIVLNVATDLEKVSGLVPGGGRGRSGVPEGLNPKQFTPNCVLGSK